MVRLLACAMLLAAMSAEGMCVPDERAAGPEESGEPAYEIRHPLQSSPATFSDYGGVVWWQSDPVRHDGHEFVRLTLTQLANPRNERAFFVVRDAQGRELERIAFHQQDLRRPVSTRRHYVDEVTATVEAPSRPRRLKFTLSEYYTAAGTLPEALSLVAADDPFEEVAALAGASAEARYASGVVNLLFVENGMKSCSGFLVGPDRIMTNRHCIKNSIRFQTNAISCDDVEVQLDYRDPNQTPIKLGCQSAQAHDVLDIAILHIKPGDAAQLNGRHIFSFADSAEQLPMRVNVLHHPAGMPMRLSRQCRVVDRATDGSLRHLCNTIGGSSGSPLINGSGDVIGVQYKGLPEMSKREYDEQIVRGVVFYNHAIDSQKIREQIQELSQ